MIIHIDMDAFFVSCERVINPALKKLPVAVGGRGDPFIFGKKSHNNIDTTLQNSGAFVPTLFYDARSSFEKYFVENKKIRGIVITSSYEARAFGIKTGMTIRKALGLCPTLIVLPPNHLFYHERSYALKLWLKERIPLLEQYSIDEFFGDLKGWIDDKEVPEFIEDLRVDIKKRFSLPASIGAAPSKWIAKVATGAAKPNGCKTIFEKDVNLFIDRLPIDAFPGIGRGFSRRLKSYKIETLGDLKASRHLLYRWKKPGIRLYHRVKGDDNEQVVANRKRGSIGISRTMDPIIDRDEVKRRLTILCRHLAHLVLKTEVEPQTLFLRIKYQFGQRAGQSLSIKFIFSEMSLRQHAIELFEEMDIYRSLSVIKLSVICGNFENRPTTRGSLITHEKDLKMRILSLHATKIRQKYGIDMFRSAIELL